MLGTAQPGDRSDSVRIKKGIKYAFGLILGGFVLNSAVRSYATSHSEVTSPLIVGAVIFLDDMAGAISLIGTVNVVLFVPVLVIHLIRKSFSD